MTTTEEQLKKLFQSQIPQESLETLQEEISKQNEMELTITAIYCMSRVLKDDTQMPAIKLMKLGEQVQILEHLCAKIKKVILDTKVCSFPCPKCSDKIPEMTLEFHLKKCNLECGKHDEFTFE